MRIRWTRNALANLEAISDYIAQDNPVAADKMVEQIYSAIQTLSDHPSIGRPGRVPGTRELVISNTPYIIPYRLIGSEVHLLRIFHSSRKWPVNM